MSSPGRSDDELIAALARRETAALEELYDRYRSVAYSLAYRIVGDKGAAEDVVQDAFLAVWRRASSYRPGRGRVRSWLMAIVHHRGVDRLRSASAAPADLAYDELPDFEALGPPVEEQVWTQQRGGAVRDALERLPPDQRKSVELAYFSGYTHVEIAQLMGVPLGTVKGRLRMALQKLRLQLEGTAFGMSGA